MRVFEALGCAVFDEPYYAYWLKAMNKVDDPGYSETVQRHETDWRKINELVLGDVPEGRAWYYQKHMALHMLPEVDLDWMAHEEVVNCFLIRNPVEVILSMTEFRGIQKGASTDVQEAAALVGIPQLKRIFQRACEISDSTPPILDANDLLMNPRETLAKFCEAVGMPFDADAPIHWKPGKHPYDGAWADAWYQKVFQTTGLGTYQPKSLEVPEELQGVVDLCLPVYQELSHLKVSV